MYIYIHMNFVDSLWIYFSRSIYRSSTMGPPCNSTFPPPIGNPIGFSEDHFFFLAFSRNFDLLPGDWCDEDET